MKAVGRLTPIGWRARRALACTCARTMADQTNKFRMKRSVFKGACVHAGS